jgi:hypothetical protein
MSVIFLREVCRGWFFLRPSLLHFFSLNIASVMVRRLCLLFLWLFLPFSLKTPFKLGSGMEQGAAECEEACTTERFALPGSTVALARSSEVQRFFVGGGGGYGCFGGKISRRAKPRELLHASNYKTRTRTPQTHSESSPDHASSCRCYSRHVRLVYDSFARGWVGFGAGRCRRSVRGVELPATQHAAPHVLPQGRGRGPGAHSSATVFHAPRAAPSKPLSYL